jgi:hypothetical protein
MDNLEITNTIFSPEHDPGSGRPEDAQRLIEPLADDVVFKVTIPDGTPISGQFRGKQAVVDHLTRLGQIAVFRQEKAQEYFANGDRVVVLGENSFAPGGCSTASSRLSLYPRSYPQAGRDPPEPAGAHRSNRTQSEPAGRLPRFRYEVPISPLSARSEDRGPFVSRRGPGEP